jgi:hypothetical protein
MSTTPEKLPDTPFYAIVITWDAKTGEIKLNSDGMSPFELYGILTAAAEDIWFYRPDVSVTVDGIDFDAAYLSEEDDEG